MKKRKNFRHYLPLYFMMTPGLLYLLVNNYIPMAGLVLAFKKFNYSLGIWKSPLNGLANFKFLFVGKDPVIALRNTLLYNLAFILLGNLLAITVGVALSQVVNKYVQRAYQTIILIPYLISIVIISYMVYGFLSTDRGLFNHLISNAGGEPVSWYTEPKYWPFILVLVNLWKSFGYSSILYFTAILGIDTSQFEAAEMDGASKWKQIRHITLPSLRPTAITLVLLSVGKIFYSDFGLFYQVPMNSGPLMQVTNTIDTYVYRALLTMNDVGRSAAAGFIQSLCGFVIVFLANYIVSRLDPDNALF